MESLQTIKRRISGVKNIGQITKAMELVAATKMRRSQEIALSSRPYALAALELLANLEKSGNVIDHPLLVKRDIKKTALVLVTSDKGLAGAFNSNVIRAFEEFLNRNNKSNTSNSSDKSDFSFIAVGQKAAAFMNKKVGNVDQKFVRFGDFTTIDEILPFANYLVDGYLKGVWDRVVVFSMQFRSALKQEVIQRQIFPVDFATIKRTAEEIIPEHGRFAELLKEKGVKFFEHPTSNVQLEYLIEPSPEMVLSKLIPQLVVMEIYHFILEANASEHAARRTAMKSASDNATDLAQNLTIVYNKSRQASITKELVEITAGAEALK
jgi:F-type H+-transporting ATPase subunit gamma